MEQQMSSITSTAANVMSSTSTTMVSNQGQQQSSQQRQLQLLHDQKSIFVRSSTLVPQSPASRPEDLHVKPWYAVDDNASSLMASKDSPPAGTLGGDQSSCPVYQSYELDSSSNHKDTTSTRCVDGVSTRTNSMESEAPRSSIPRKAYMDLNDAMALLDETCPNPDVSPQMTPRTPRTPLTPHPRNKRARSKSSDNSSNYSSERLNEKSENAKEKERKRPFLKKIGISMTEDRPLLSILAPRIIGKPYLEKIGPSRAIDKPFLEKIGSSRTLDKFTFDTPKIYKKKDIDSNNRKTIIEEPEMKTPKERRDEIRGFSTGERRRSGKNFLSKMYSFETEDLEDTSLVIKAPHRDPLRGASLDDVLDSGPSSMPRINELCAMTNSDIETPSMSVAELVKCRVTTSEEIISSNSCLNSPMDIISWGNSPKRKDQPTRNATPTSGIANKENKNNESVPNSPTKRTHSITPEKVTAIYKDLEKLKNGRQASDEILDKRKSRYDQFETRSSDNLTKERVATPVFAEIGSKNINGKGSNTSVISSTSSTRQVHDKFDSQDVFTETYAEFKRRTQGNFNTSNALKRLIVREKTISPSFDLGFSSKDAMLEKIKSEGSPKVRSKSAETERQKNDSKDKLEVNNRRLRNRSVLRKQQGIDHSNYPNEPNDSETNPIQRWKIVHEPSQETLNLLSELQKVKSQLKTPTIDKTYELDNATELKPFPKRILLTDKEFCLSVERENSVRRPSRVNTLEGKPDYSAESNKSPEKQNDTRILGPALFEKRCLSLDFADDEKSIAQKSEPRAISLASARSPHSEDLLESAEIGLITSDSKSYSSDVFSSPTDEIAEKTILDTFTANENKKIENEVNESNTKIAKTADVLRTTKNDPKKVKDEKSNKTNELNKSPRSTEKIEKLESTEDKKDELNDKADQMAKQKNLTDPDSATRDLQVSPKKKSDSFEIPSPKATPFRMKKRLGRISVEETVKQESFTVNKVDCKEVAVQKRAKCLPL